jgi:hypothetical protein
MGIKLSVVLLQKNNPSFYFCFGTAEQAGRGPAAATVVDRRDFFTKIDHEVHQVIDLELSHQGCIRQRPYIVVDNTLWL